MPMLLHVKDILDAAELAEMRARLAAAPWCDGRVTAGAQSATVKHNLQLPEVHPVTQALQEQVVRGLNRSTMFFSAALPKRIVPPLFNRYEGAANYFGDHVDNAMRIDRASGQRIRTDLSATLFLAEPDDYDGGELVIVDTFGTQRIKLPAGDLVLYPSSSVHRVEPVTRGARMASFFWIESMVRSDEQRRLLFDLDMALLDLRREQGETALAVSLTSTYHNLLRMWADA